ncbi:efflux RND transporter permease subunit [Candidatus Sumerlaeota bacterium]|nr:efflux RND transporter permease subunit [Candidatus Sumerlaeota bacterium]
MSLSHFAVNSPVKVAMIFIGVLLLGWISLTRLPTNLFPDIRAPKVTVTVTTRGLSPSESERRICEVLERSLYSVRGVQSVESIARADSAIVIANFDWETELDFAFLEVKKAASDLQRQRSTEIDSLNVLRYDPNSTPIMTVALTAPEEVDQESLYRTAEQTLKPRFERLTGVANVVLTGGLKREIHIALDQSLLLAYDLQVSGIVSALQADNVDASGGWVEENARRYLIRAVGEFRDLDDIRRVVVGRKGTAAILLSDVATVEMRPKEAKSIVYLNGEPALGMAFFREADSNTVAVAALIRKELEEIRKSLPETWKFTIADDQSEFVSGAIREVRNNAIIGGLLSILILVIFLRDLRTTIIIGISIPVSIIATFNIMYFQGLSLNLMSLGGLALGVGMLVDNSIVVLENIHRLRVLGFDARRAALQGTQEVSGALIASTLTTVAVFLPIAYTRGIAALMFKEQALTVAYSLFASLVVALLLIPMLSTYFFGRTSIAGTTGSHRAGVPSNPYTRLLAACLRFRFIVMVGAFLLFAIAAALFSRIPREFLPRSDSRIVQIRVNLPNGTPIEGTDRVIKSIMSQLNRFQPAIENVYTCVGEAEGVVNANTEDPDGPNTADIFVSLKDADKPTTEMLDQGLANFRSSQLVAAMKPILETAQDVKADFRSNSGSLLDLIGSAGAPLVIEISGPEIDQLTTIASRIRDRLSNVPQLANLRTNILEGAPEVLLKFDKAQLTRHGLDVNGVAQILRQRIDGEVATQVRREAGDVDLNVAVDYGAESLDTLRNITFRSGNGTLVRLASIAQIDVVRAPREIVRKKQSRVAYVMADLAPGVKLSQAITNVQKRISDIEIPGRYRVTFTGEEQQREEAFGNLTLALILSIFLVYMVMASIFESFLQPFLIMITIPLAGIGVVGSLLLANQTLNVMSIIGIVILGGIVVNNAIVLLDCVNQIRDEVRRDGGTLSENESLLIGCNQRLRPVIMTTGTTVLGLLPMAIGIGDGAEMRQAMSVTVLGGLITSTILTLFVIPCGQTYLDSVMRLLRNRKPAAVPAEEVPPSPHTS